MSKFTPGPWEWRNVVGAGLQIRGNPGPRDFGHYKFTGEGPVHLYTLRKESPQFDFADERWTQFPQAEWDEMQEANARLIAAAPDLLAACERAEALLDALLSFYGLGLDVINWHKNGDAEPLDNFIDDNSDGGELTALRAAIAKAKGEPAP